MKIFNSFRVISCLISKINLNISTKKKSRVWTYFEEDSFYQSAARWESKIPFTWVSNISIRK